MTVPSVTMLLISATLVGTGVYLVLDRTLSRIFIGLSLMTHGINVLLLSAGGASGRPALLGAEPVDAMADPLPQAMMLTSIVLSLGTTAFGLALAYRQWRLSGHDEVVDDIEDRILARMDDNEITEHIGAGSSGEEDADINYDDDEATPTHQAQTHSQAQEQAQEKTQKHTQQQAQEGERP